MERHPHPHLHRIRRHEALPAPAARSRDRRNRSGRRTHRHLPRPHAAATSARRSSRPSTPTRSKHPVRILIATDAAREGLNLQAHCWNLFHFDVPWNPSRMEQRNGRIDRKLQPNAEVFCHYFVYTDRPEDRILPSWSARRNDQAGAGQPVPSDRRPAGRDPQAGHPPPRHRHARQRLEDTTPTGRQPASRRGGTGRGARASGRPESPDPAAPNRLKASQDWLSLHEDHFRSAISCALEMMGADPLKPLAREQDWDNPIDRFEFPALDQRQGADPTWADTMDTLRPPRETRQKPWEWRRESPIRPVVFDDTGTMDQDVVHLHLEHSVRGLFARLSEDAARHPGHHGRAPRRLGPAAGAVPAASIGGARSGWIVRLAAASCSIRTSFPSSKAASRPTTSRASRPVSDGCMLRILAGLMTWCWRRASGCPTARSTSSRSARSTRR